jgi:hypothetical protein
MLGESFGPVGAITAQKAFGPEAQGMRRRKLAEGFLGVALGLGGDRLAKVAGQKVAQKPDLSRLIVEVEAIFVRRGPRCPGKEVG